LTFARERDYQLAILDINLNGRPAVDESVRGLAEKDNYLASDRWMVQATPWLMHTWPRRRSRQR
jgi:hypothetical protein